MLPRISRDGEPSITDPALFLRQLGNLHDALIPQLRWDVLEKRVVLFVDDIYANFEGLPEYPGLHPARIICDGVFRIEVDIMADEFPLKMMDLEIESPESAPPFHVQADLSSGRIIRIECNSIACQASD